MAEGRERSVLRGVAVFLAMATGAYAAALLVATHYPRPQVVIQRIIEQPVINRVVTEPPSDKTLHLWAYTPLAVLAGTTAAVCGRRSGRAVVGLAAGLALFAAADEATQPLPWFRRTADLGDWAYDCLGIAIGLSLVASLVVLGRSLRRGAADGLQ